MARAWLCLLVLLLNGACALGDGAGALADFDMAFDEEGGPLLVVNVTFRGEKHRFEMDTGSSGTTFDARLAHLLGRRSGTSLYHAPGAVQAKETFVAPPCFIGSLRLPSLEAVDCGNVNRAEVVDDQRVDGILGMDALHGCIICLDFDRAKISFLRCVPADPGARFELAGTERAPTITALLGRCGPRSFIVDTGCNGEMSVARRDFAALLERYQLSLAGTRSVRTAAGTFGGRLGVLLGDLTVGPFVHSSIAVGELPDSRLPVKIAGHEYIDAPNVLGLEYLSRYVVTFDFAHHAMYLKPGATFRALRAPAALGGVRLVREGDNVIVLSVRAATRAAPYARPNDVLETINSTRLNGLPDTEIVRLLTDATVERKLRFRHPADGNGWWILLDALPVPESVAKATQDAHAESARTLEASDPAKGAGRPGWFTRRRWRR